MIPVNPRQKVAFLTHSPCGKLQQVLRGALRFAEAHPPMLVRVFGRQPNGAFDCVSPGTLRALREWSPDGLLTALDAPDLEHIIKEMGSGAPPAVNCMIVPHMPGVTQVVGSMPDVLTMALEHFGQLGTRSHGFVSLDPGAELAGRMRASLADSFSDKELDGMILHVPSDESKTANPEIPVTPVPGELADWLRGLPKPAGVLVIELGGGSYLLRVCEALGLRVPEDVAVIGVGDEADACLSQDPPLTSIGVAGEALGSQAMKVLHKLMGAGKSEPLVLVKGVELQVRQSTGHRRPEICDIPGALEYIRTHACRGLRVQELVKATQTVSNQTFQKYFQAKTGSTPGEVIRGRQFEEARRLLTTTELPMSLVAEMSGFASSNDFARAFRVHEGVSPTEYRKGNAKAP